MNFINTVHTIYANTIRWLTIPQSAPEMNRRNFINVQIDAVGVGLASTAMPFLPVFLYQLHATTFQITMLTFMPAVTGLALAMPLGQFLQSRKNIIPWFSFARLSVLSSYALTGIITFFLPDLASVIGILGIWAIATIPQTILNITFSVVMNSVAGPAGRYELMTHRWSILAFTNTITALIAGQLLEMLPFPINFQMVFIALSVGGLISYKFSSKITLPEILTPISTARHSWRQNTRETLQLIWKEKPFVSFIVKRFVFLSGAALAIPLLPIYYLEGLKASNFYIALISIATNSTVIIGYFFWMRQSRRRGSQIVLIATTLGGSLYPILVGFSQEVWPVVVFAGLNGIFQAGLNLVLFDELMKRVPIEYSATFIAAAQSLQYMSSIATPLLAPVLASTIGLGPGLMLSGGISLIGFVLFLLEYVNHPAAQKAGQEIPAEID